MAYANFQELGGAGAVHAVTVRASAVGLTALEWSVVALARSDGRASLRQPGPVTTALRVLFNGRDPRLADARLEALRRMAVLSWRDGYTVPSQEVRAFLAAGFSVDQYELVVDSIGAARSRRPALSGTAAVRAPASPQPVQG